MLQIKSKTDENKLYFFECLGYITSKHLEKGLFVGVPSKLENTLIMRTSTPALENKELLIDIIRNSDSLELNAAYDAENFYGVFKFLRTQGVFELPYKIHTLTKI